MVQKESILIQNHLSIQIQIVFMLFLFRFEDDEALSELDEEVVLPKNARVIRANVLGNLKMQKTIILNNNISCYKNRQGDLAGKIANKNCS